MINLILAITLVVAFFLCIAAYSLGLKHGKQLANNQIPKTELNPVKIAQNVHKEIQQERKEQEVTHKADQEQEGWRNIMSYDGDKQKGAS